MYTGHLSSACLSHASGGCGTTTVHDVEYSCDHTVEVVCTSFDHLAHSDCPPEGVTELDADVSRDGEEAHTGGTSEYTEEVGTYLGDLVIRTLLPSPSESS